DSTGATRESEIRTLKERLDSRLASEKRLREEVKTRSAEATTLAEQLRASRQEAESLACECRDQRRQLEAGLSSQIEQLETEQADKLKAAAKEFQDRLDAKEREFQAKFQVGVLGWPAYNFGVVGLEARELAEGRLRRQLEAAEAERDAALAELSASQSTSVEEVERLRAPNSPKPRLAAWLRSRLLANCALSWRPPLPLPRRGRQLPAQKLAKEKCWRSLEKTLSSLRYRLRTMALIGCTAWLVKLTNSELLLDGRHTGDSVSAEDYEAVKMYAADLQKQLMSVSSELSELRTRGPQPPPPQPPAPVASSRPDRHKTRAFTDIPEVEYLRNVLYKYMLGEKTQTLARVICTVLKFTDYQIQQIMDHEGKRAAVHLADHFVPLAHNVHQVAQQQVLSAPLLVGFLPILYAHDAAELQFEHPVALLEVLLLIQHVQLAGPPDQRILLVHLGLPSTNQLKPLGQQGLLLVLGAAGAAQHAAQPFLQHLRLTVDVALFRFQSQPLRSNAEVSSTRLKFDSTVDDGLAASSSLSSSSASSTRSSAALGCRFGVGFQLEVGAALPYGRPGRHLIPDGAVSVVAAQQADLLGGPRSQIAVAFPAQLFETAAGARTCWQGGGGGCRQTGGVGFRFRHLLLLLLLDHLS
uniref:GRIP domain-containing protein n=1 Tax=Macrostomum lignano TaxID=282301 RepID=A0A1I8F2T0_9PLAT